MGGLFGGGGQSFSETRLGGLQVSQSVYGIPIPMVYGKTRITCNLIDYVDFNGAAHTSSAGGKGGGSSNTSYSYSATILFGLCIGGASGEIQLISAWQDKNKWTTTVATTGSATSPVNSALGSMAVTTPYSTPAAMYTAMGGWNLFDGNSAQSAWGYMTTNHADHAIDYRGLAYFSCSNFGLLSGATMGNWSYEVKGLKRYSVSIDDANPVDVLTDFFTHPSHGAGFPAAKLGDLSNFSNWCVASGLFISPFFVTQKPAIDHWVDILDALASEAVYSDGLLKIIPYGDAAITGNGVTFTPNLSPAYYLTDDDYLDANQPVLATRIAQANAYNQIPVEYANRANDYILTTMTVNDQATIENYGLRPDSVHKWNFIAAPAVAAIAAQMKLQRSVYVRNQYTVRLSWMYARVEPMDILALNESALGLANYLVRIVSTDENADGEITVVAEELVYGVTAAAMFGTGDLPSGSIPNSSTAPGSVTAPLMFEPPLSITTNGQNELWVAVGGGANWGGCNIWTSLDGSTYQKVATITGAARYGTLHTAVAAPSAQPDITNTVTVDLADPQQLYSGSMADVLAYATLCYLGGEIFAYRDATLVAAQEYTLGYLERGLYGTTGAAHSVGAAFARLDTSIYKNPLTGNLVGSTMYFKFTSFNLWGQAEENLASVTAFTHTVVGGLPSGPSNLGLVSPFTGLSFTGQWSGVTGATSYTVQVYVDAVLRHTYTAYSTAITYGHADAVADGYVGRNIGLNVATVSGGQTSGYSQISFSNPLPAAITGISSAATTTTLTPSWGACTDTDLQDYQVFLSTSSGFTPGSGNLKYTGTANTCTITGLTTGTTYYLRICARDQWGGTTWNYSAEQTEITL